MFQNYLKIAIRSLLKQKLYSSINILSLSLGIACCILVYLFINNEWSYDRFHENAPRIYRAAVQEDYGEGQTFFNTSTPVPLAGELQKSFAEVENSMRIATTASIVRRGEHSFQERVHLADAALFDMFNFAIIDGDRQNALADPSSVVITAATAAKYFADASPLGATLSIAINNEVRDFTVAAVAADPPTASSIRFDFVISFENMRYLASDRFMQSWFMVYPETYVLLKAGQDIAALTPKLPDMIKKVFGERYQPGAYEVLLQPLTDIHLNRHFPPGIEPISDPRYSYILAAIALGILLIACINFTTLAVGRSLNRAREVGVRKVVGASRSDLIWQFWGEALLFSMLALLAGYALAEFFLPMFNQLAGKTLALSLNGTTVLLLIALTLVIGVIAGSYPALVLSGFHPAAVLKGDLTVSRRNRLREGLVIIQFALGILLVVTTLLMNDQLRFLMERDPGFNKDQVLIAPLDVSPESRNDTFVRLQGALRQLPSVAHSTYSICTFGEGWIDVGFDASDGSYRGFQFNVVAPNFIPAMGMTLVEGRSFSGERESDRSEAIIVNEAFVREFGLQPAIGARLPAESYGPHQIIGVVKDFHFQSYHSRVAPLVLALDNRMIFRGSADVSLSSDGVPKVAIRIRPENISATVADIQAVWNATLSDVPFEYSFLNDNMARQYQAERRLGRIVRYATLASILIACLGLFALASLNIDRRIKEIGVRKVLGATIGSIIILISRDILRIVLIAFVIATPLTIFFMDRWLADFAYRISYSPLTFILAGAGVMAMAWLTVAYQAIRAAVSDPVKTLRYE